MQGRLNFALKMFLTDQITSNKELVNSLDFFLSKVEKSFKYQLAHYFYYSRVTFFLKTLDTLKII